MRPLAILVALCFVPTADACFLKCFRKQSPGTVRMVPVVRVNVVQIISVDGQAVGMGLDPEVRHGVEGIPVRVRTNFNPIQMLPGHQLTPPVVGGTEPTNILGPVTQTIILGPDGEEYWYEFTYSHLPALAANTNYTLRISVGSVSSETVRFHTGR